MGAGRGDPQCLRPYYNEAEIAAATRSIEVREEIARRAYAGAPEPG